MIVILFLLVLVAGESHAQSPYQWVQRTLHSAATGTATGELLDVSGWATVTVQASGITTATITAQVSNDTVQGWNNAPCVKNDGSVASTLTADGSLQCSVSGYKYFKAPVSSYTSGTIKVVAVKTTATGGSVGGSGGGGGGSFDGIIKDGTGDTTQMNVSGGRGQVENYDPASIAHDSADSGNPKKIGFKATSSISAKTMVANDDRTDAFSGLDGVQITRPHSNLEDRVSAVVGVTDGSSTSLVAAQGAGIRFCATTIVVSNSSATNVTVDIRDGTAGSVIMTLPAAANMGGAVVPLQTPICTSANTAMAMDPSAAASTVTVTAVGFKTKL